MSVPCDPIFEFDAPQAFVDLRSLPKCSGVRDPWFDHIHVNHSKPSDELAEELSKLTQNEATKVGDKEIGAHGRKRPTATTTVPSTAQRVLPHKHTEAPVQRTKSAVQSIARRATATGVTTSDTSARHQTKLDVKAPAPTRQDPTATGRREAPTNSFKNGRKSDSSDLQDLQVLLAQHNKKFKANHTYEPRHHSVRDVKLWEQQTKKSYYKLSLEERYSANQEITKLMQQRSEQARDSRTSTR
ncbi:TPA: hypothetical protein N0F65_008163 [Lagenidium giganteum]|uniref:Uncharacterized protein n=1 Tax=Lagenidium giganteum TaxID=4803 RepID=A0AAV2YL60_9STRA|nr:TPA: hypothetical protein N0F65_008163 [Lagenidium giganteum]